MAPLRTLPRPPPRSARNLNRNAPPKSAPNPPRFAIRSERPGNTALTDTNIPLPHADPGGAYWRSPPPAARLAPSLNDADFRAFAENLPALCFIADADGAVLWLNRRWHEYCGATPHQPPAQLWQSAQLPQILQRWANAMASGKAFELTAELRGADGIHRPFLGRAWPLPGPAGKPRSWFGLAIETNTGRIPPAAAEPAPPAQPETPPPQAANAAGAMIWSATPDGRTDFYNSHFYDFTGVPKGAPDVDLWTTVLHPDDWMRTAARWNESVAAGQPFEIEYRLRHHAGEYRWALSRATLSHGPAGNNLRWYGTITDIHDRRSAESALRQLNDTLEQRVAEEVAQRAKAEDALRQAQKMEAVGQLTGGIAHDFNNLLTVIAGNIDTAARALAHGGGDIRARRALESAMNGAERATALTQRLLAFARRQPLAPRPVDVGKLVAGMSDLLKRALGETIRLDVSAAPALWQVNADPNQLESAILNLAVNARDAMPAGGRLSIRTDNENIDPAIAAQHAGLQPGDYVTAAVSDTGTGMPPEIISRAFEPFFTTKEVGRGTGLGLSQVYGFVKQSGGYVMIQSRVGEGSVVKIHLPRVEATAAEYPAPAPPAPHRTAPRTAKPSSWSRMTTTSAPTPSIASPTSAIKSWKPPTAKPPCFSCNSNPARRICYSPTL